MRNCQKLYERLITGIHEIGHDPARFEKGAEYNDGWDCALDRAEDLIVKAFMKQSYCGAENLDLITDPAKVGTDDPVNHPAHYTSGSIEVIDYIEDQRLPYHLGNAVKYISRAGKKDPDKTVEDLKKAVWYLNRYIRKLEYEKEALAWTD